MHGRVFFMLLALALSAGLIGCAQGPDAPSGRFLVGPGSYEAAFDASREALTDLGFTLERIDARAGIITTEPLGSGGLATPWDTQQLSLDAELADLAHTQSRLVQVTFIPESVADRIPSDDPALQIAGGEVPASVVTLSENEPIVGEVRVIIKRRYQPNWRPAALSVRHSSHARDPLLRSSGIGRLFDVAVTRDNDLERRLAGRIAQQLAQEIDSTH